MSISQGPDSYPVIVFREKGQSSVRSQFFLGFFDLEPKDGLSYHVPTLLVKEFACRQSLYTRFYSGQQGFLFLRPIFYRGIWVPGGGE
jgi:hypothetical protein